MMVTLFTGSIASLYETHLVPLLFEPWAVRLARALANRPAPVTSVLEVAAGTGAVTRALASTLPPRALIVATDLNQAMIDQAAKIGTHRPVEWRQADALSLPFPERSFDAVVCQFGAMFFPDKPRAFSEARRVLRPGGVFLFDIWDRIEDNELAFEIETAVGALFPTDPPRFLSRTPYGHHDVAAIRRDLAAGGFRAPATIETAAERSRAPSARIPAIAFCQGTPLRTEIEARDPSRLAESTTAAERAITARFGAGPIDTKMQAHIITVE